ncbi:unnamed protein product [Closterium sp. NIES-64]|nr:unnamed protein product [Closterium sp. NIES-64]
MGRVGEGGVVLLPHTLVDTHVRSDAATLTPPAAAGGEGSGAGGGYAVYVLNPRVMPRRYAYSYGSRGDTVCPGTSFHDEVTSCAHALWRCVPPSIARCPPLAAPRLLPLACCPSLAAPRSLPPARFPSLAAPRLLPIARCPSLAAPRSLPLACCPSLAAHRLLPIACCPSLAAHRLLPIACCPSLAAPRSLPLARCPCLCLHLPVLAPACACTCLCLHLPVLAPACACTCLCLHLPVLAPACACTCLCLHLPRYVWVDLTAGPVSYGPAWGGQGGVTPAAYLRAEQYSKELLHGVSTHGRWASTRACVRLLVLLSRLPAIAACTSSSLCTHLLLSPSPAPELTRSPPTMAVWVFPAFLAHVAVLVDSAVRHVFVPPLLHAPVVYAVTTDIWVIAMHSGATGDGGRAGDEGMGLDLSAIKDQLLARSPPVVLGGQQVRFKQVHLSLATCSFCSTALHRAMRSGLYEASAGAASSSAAGVPGGMEVRRHLDSEDLHRHLSEFWPEITELAGLPLPDYAERNDPKPHAGRFFPVFLFDLHAPYPLLLDGRHRALAYDDMVLAVRSTAPPLPSHYMCEGEGVDMDPSNVTRPVLSAILHTAWGLAPTHEAWSAIHNASQHDYRWSSGMTPMGPFSRHLTLTTTMRDTALRNVVLSTLNSTISSMLHLLSALQRYGSEEAALKPGAVRQRFEQRWGVLRHKLQRAAAALSAVDMHLAGYYARSARHDMDALFELAGQSAQDMHTSFSCFQEAPVAWSVWGGGAVLAYLAFLVGRNRWRVWHVKHKRF